MMLHHSAGAGSGKLGCGSGVGRGGGVGIRSLHPGGQRKCPGGPFGEGVQRGLCQLR
jgi:hypothetical protein